MEGKVKLELKGVDKVFHLGRTKVNDVQVVFDINFQVFEKEFVIICGPSGSGKSTILSILIGLEHPTKGKVFHDGIDIYKLKRDKRAKLRLHSIGIVLQQSIWLKNMTVVENVAMPYFLSGHGYRESIEKATEMLKKIKMDEYVKRLPSELSGGQQQKIALVRSLMNDPDILVADEPTGNLDTDSSTVLMDQLVELNEKFHKTIIVVTHNLSYLKLADRSFYVKDGHLSKVDFSLKHTLQNTGVESISDIEKMAK